MQNNDFLLKRAKRKYINTPIISALVDLKSSLSSRYLLTSTCAGLLTVSDNKIKSRYCKRLWCAVCNPIKTAIRLNSYSKQLEAIPDLQFTTLTLPNVYGSDIKKTFQHFTLVLRQFRNSYNKVHNMPFIGVYNFEVTLNLQTKKFHPHVHILHSYIEVETSKDDKDVNSLILYWLNKTKTAKLAAQDTRPCTDLIEGFKYATKTQFYSMVDGKRCYKVPAKMLDTLYQQLKSVRMFNSFGIKSAKNENDINAAMDQLEAYTTDATPGDYIWKLNDWFLTIATNEDGEAVPNFSPGSLHHLLPLTNYIPNSQTKKMYEDLCTNQNG